MNFIDGEQSYVNLSCGVFMGNACRQRSGLHTDPSSVAAAETGVSPHRGAGRHFSAGVSLQVLQVQDVGAIVRIKGVDRFLPSLRDVPFDDVSDITAPQR